MYSVFEQILTEKGLKPSDVARETCIPKSTFSEWKKGTYSPKREKLVKIAEFLDVSIEYLMGEEKPTYYIDVETAELAQEMKDRQELRLLFSASKFATSEEILEATEFLLSKKKKERGDS